MKPLGSQLRIIRERLRKSLRDVALESQAIAQRLGSDQYQISASWLARVESDPARDISALRLIALLISYKITLEELISIDPDEETRKNVYGDFGDLGVSTALLSSGAEEEARRLLPDETHGIRAIEISEILSPDSSTRNRRYIRVLIGKEQNYLTPTVPSGSIALVDTHRRSLLVGWDADDEIHRPMFLLELRGGRYICCWCEMVDKDAGWIVVIPHPCRPMKPLQLRLGKDATVRGRIVAVRITTLLDDSQ